MKGIVLAGGTGSRLHPLTDITNKHLLPVYNKPMIYYPILTLRTSGINDIMIISGKGHAGHFLELLGGTYTYRIQERPNGIAGALMLAEDWVGNDDCAVILGDNIFQNMFEDEIESFKGGCHLFLKYVDNPSNFGVPEFNDDGSIKKIIEKPIVPPSRYAITGFYIYDCSVFDILKEIQLSRRQEYEITDVNNAYISKGACKYTILNAFWSDAGTFDSLLTSSIKAKELNL
jgi:glucose-1-phosphate thymidylyltransferase